MATGPQVCGEGMCVIVMIWKYELRETSGTQDVIGLINLSPVQEEKKCQGKNTRIKTGENSLVVSRGDFINHSHDAMITQ
ncbi:hypothetical protein E2C01_090871 [Portunus trituberculatus]|uniref:Uncharacterized protein n=1 Tax=Portunus trituberculatus TaxID=210409 RepID=A0A5B7JCI9_PORTR|nr:hypothetical protein [Portunus trituberculatus]